jgi:molybdopterin converting factor small subunit
MALVFIIPGPLREHAEDCAVVRIRGSAGSVSEALALLWERHPGLRDRVVSELGEVRPHINIFVDGESIRYAGELSAPVRDDAEIVILPALSGG